MSSARCFLLRGRARTHSTRPRVLACRRGRARLPTAILTYTVSCPYDPPFSPMHSPASPCFPLALHHRRVHIDSTVPAHPRFLLPARLHSIPAHPGPGDSRRTAIAGFKVVELLFNLAYSSPRRAGPLVGRASMRVLRILAHPCIRRARPPCRAHDAHTRARCLPPTVDLHPEVSSHAPHCGRLEVGETGQTLQYRVKSSVQKLCSPAKKKKKKKNSCSLSACWRCVCLPNKVE
ncbi:hypothetical protein B0H16DRAFT_450140 [Mycena metata]|uniref:Uncharacterized protein n=1 Tax=Mycena metata TaxID=1033252 RepID=A0AAD7MHD0_9AGAR|nr:hypothetical protein B0H16DRAFT_450140 [Mycena metata]